MLTDDAMWNILSESFTDSLPLIPVLLPVYVALEYFSHHGGQDLVARLRINRANGPVAGTLLGIIPQCGMSVLVTSFYLMRRVTTGTLIATYLATSDEAIPILLAHHDRLHLVGGLVLVKAVVAIGWGYAIDVVLRSPYDSQVADAARLAPESAVHLAPVAWREIILHGVRHTLDVFGIVFVVTVVLSAVLAASPTQQVLELWATHPYLQVFPAATFGLIPNCAASVAIVETFLKGGLSPGAAIAGLCAGAGFGPILLLKDGDRRVGAKLLWITLGAAVLTGLLLNWLYLPGGRP